MCLALFTFFYSHTDQTIEMILQHVFQSHVDNLREGNKTKQINVIILLKRGNVHVIFVGYFK